MQSVITSKYQTTIPKAVREQLKLSINDTLEWKVDNGRIILSPIQKRFLLHQDTVKIGKGDIVQDLEIARRKRAQKHL